MQPQNVIPEKYHSRPSHKRCPRLRFIPLNWHMARHQLHDWLTILVPEIIGGTLGDLDSPWIRPSSLFSHIFNGLLFGWTLRMYRPNLKSQAPFSPKFLMGFCSDGPCECTGQTWNPDPPTSQTDERTDGQTDDIRLHDRALHSSASRGNYSLEIMQTLDQ